MPKIYLFRSLLISFFLFSACGVSQIPSPTPSPSPTPVPPETVYARKMVERLAELEAWGTAFNSFQNLLSDKIPHSGSGTSSPTYFEVIFTCVLQSAFPPSLADTCMSPEVKDTFLTITQEALEKGRSVITTWVLIIPPTVHLQTAHNTVINCVTPVNQTLQALVDWIGEGNSQDLFNLGDSFNNGFNFNQCNSINDAVSQIKIFADTYK